MRLLRISVTCDACVYSRFSHILYIPDNSKTLQLFSRYLLHFIATEQKQRSWANKTQTIFMGYTLVVL